MFFITATLGIRFWHSKHCYHHDKTNYAGLIKQKKKKKKKKTGQKDIRLLWGKGRGIIEMSCLQNSLRELISYYDIMSWAGSIMMSDNHDKKCSRYGLGR